MADKDLSLLTVKELQQVAIEAGLPAEAAKTFLVKTPLIATIQALQAKTVTQPETPPADGSGTPPVEKVETLDPPANPAEERTVAKQHASKARTMYEYLESQPKVPFMFPLDPKEKPGVVRVVIKNGMKEYFHVSGAVKDSVLNGYHSIWPKGVQIKDMPEPIAADFLTEMQVNSQIGQDIAIDRTDPETGKPVSDQL